MGWSILLGMNAALDTLVSQAAGAGQLEKCGVFLNRGRFIMTVAFIPLALLTFKIESIMVQLGQDKEVAKYT
jgi:Na+-driven multidrug efflux pump